MKKLTAVLFLVACVPVTLFAQSLGQSRNNTVMMRNINPKTASKLTSVVNALNGRSVVLVFDGGDWTIDTDVTLPSTAYVVIDPGTKLIISNGKTLTLNGGMQDGSFVRFGGAGGVAGLPFARAEWFESNGDVKAQAAVSGEVIYNGGINLGGTTRTTWPSGGTGSDELFTNWYADPDLSYIKFGGTTNIITDDGTNLVRNGVLITGGGGGNVTLSNAWKLIYSDGSTNTVELGLGTEGQFLRSSGTNSAPYFGNPIIVSNYLSGYSYSAGTFVRYTDWPEVLGWNGTYEALQATGTNLPGYGTGYWLAIALDGADGEDGTDGATGAAGAAGADGVGNILYDGAWQYNKQYVYDTGTPIWVRYSGRVYDCVQTSSNVVPTGVGATNYWMIAVDKGASGTALEYTNWFFRGAYDTGNEYTTNEAVTYAGNLFLRTNATTTGNAPSIDANSVGIDSLYWECIVQKGNVGATGAKGADGAFTTNILNYIIITNGLGTTITNLPDEDTVFIADGWEGTPGDSVLLGHWGPMVGSGSGFPLTENGDLAGYSLTNGFFAGDGSGLTNLTGVATGTPIYVELDPSFASVSNLWYGILTNVQSTAVTGAVTSVNGIDGDIVIAGATNSGQTIYVNGGDVYSQSNNAYSVGTTQTFDAVYFVSNNVELAGGDAGSSYCPMAIGVSATAPARASIAIGYRATSSGFESIALGRQSEARGNIDSDAISIGYLSRAYNRYGVALGGGANAYAVSAIAVGDGPVAYGTGSQAYGYEAKATGDYSVAIGWVAHAPSPKQITIGPNAGRLSDSEKGIFIGDYAGYGATGDMLNIIGDCTQYRYADSYLTNGIAVARTYSNEETIVFGNLRIVDPLIDNFGGGAYTNNIPSGFMITAQCGTNTSFVKFDFANKKILIPTGWTYDTE